MVVPARSKLVWPLFFALTGCSSNSDASHRGVDSGTQHGGDAASAGGGTARGGTGDTSAGGASSRGGRSGNGGATTSSSGGASPNDAGDAPDRTSGPVVHGGPGCGLAEAAFCETFDAPSSVKGRAGELDARRWSAGRLAPQLPTGNGCAIGIGPGTVPSCRAGLPETVYPDQDALVCDPTPNVASKHLLVITAAQNYGQNSYRIRQPFDFAGRTGKIVFDAEGFLINGLLGWISVEVTEDPIAAPSFSIGDTGVNNNEGSLVPRNAVEVQFQSQCGGYVPGPAVTASMIDVLHDYADHVFSPKTPTCVDTAKDKLNHFEIAISASRVEVTATSFSEDGKTFGAPSMLLAADVDVPFTRGWVQITTHNHATLKYSGPGSAFGAPESLDAWAARWDNVGFDGPVISSFREYEIPDSLTRGTNAWNRSGPIVNVGYLVADAASAPHDTLHFQGVDPTGIDTARLSLSAWYLNQSDKPLDTYALRYRFNGKAWHERHFTTGELGLLGGTHTQGQLGQMLDVDPSELVRGDNTLEFTTVNVPQNYPPVVANIDLVLTTK